jgi:hypothetical protein
MIEVDDKLWPLVVVHYEGAHTLEEFQELDRRMLAILERRQPYAAILDGRKSQGMTPEQRKRQAEWMKRNDVELRKYCLGAAFIITSSVARLTMNVMITLKPPPVPYTFVVTLEAAAVWTAAKLEAGGNPQHAQRVREVFGVKPR